MLYVVATPIGNLGDITYRAVETLKAADLIACEDTRRTRVLCDHYGITAPLTSYHSYNQRTKGERLLVALREGKRVALVSDSGTPGISDPGAVLVRQAVEAGIGVEAIPGPTALIAALCVSGLPTHRFVFEGFLPVKSGARRRRLENLRAFGGTMIFYESPHRLVKTIDDILAVLGDRPLAVGRELTKKFEELWRGGVLNFRQRCLRMPPRGEYVLVVGAGEKV
ncbi:MAG: 16S rRNA (cytidine(1402)-2'-O)-methyltransferase [Deltaproteobacteria bacterium]